MFISSTPGLVSNRTDSRDRDRFSLGRRNRDLRHRRVAPNPRWRKCGPTCPTTRTSPAGPSLSASACPAYARAWDEGAIALDSGQPVSAALDLVAKNWTSGRTALFDKLVAPEFAKIVPESIKDSDVTPQERTALAAAWRGFAVGLTR